MTENSNYPNGTATPGSISPDDGDLLLEQFFAAARAEQLPDNGFTRRVMMHLPERQRRLSQLWTMACIAVGVVLFTLIGGWQQVADGIVRVLSASYTPMQLLHLMICGAVLTTLAAVEVMRREQFT